MIKAKTTLASDNAKKCKLIKKEKFSFIIPCYNSTDTIALVSQEIKEMMRSDLSEYDYELILVNDRVVSSTRFTTDLLFSSLTYPVSSVNVVKSKL